MRSSTFPGCQWTPGQKRKRMFGWQSGTTGPENKASAKFERVEAGAVFMGNGGVWVLPAQVSPKTNCRLKPVGAASRVEEERRRASEVRAALSSIHPNPGPRSEAEKERRRLCRRRRRQCRREERVRVRMEEMARGMVVKEEMVVVAWNVQGMSVENLARRKMKMVASFAEREGWDVVLLSEVRRRGMWGTGNRVRVRDRGR